MRHFWAGFEKEAVSAEAARRAMHAAKSRHVEAFVAGRAAEAKKRLRQSATFGNYVRRKGVGS